MLLKSDKKSVHDKLCHKAHFGSWAVNIEIQIYQLFYLKKLFEDLIKDHEYWVYGQ